MLEQIKSDEDYYGELRSRTFGETDWKAEYAAAFGNGKPKVTFQLNREFNDTASFIAFDFLVELYQAYGKKILPLTIENGCIGIVSQFESKDDYRGVDFRYLMLVDPEYHDIWRRFGVQFISLTAFPSSDNADRYDRFKVDSQGMPHPW